jgi:hypothetical protein
LLQYVGKHAPREEKEKEEKSDNESRKRLIEERMEDAKHFNIKKGIFQVDVSERE